MQVNEKEKALVDLFVELTKSLKERIKGGEATASDFKNAIELLKNNNITCEIKEGEIPTDMLDELPDFPESTNIIAMRKHG